MRSLTDNQVNVLVALYKEGSVSSASISDVLDLDQLIEAVPYEVTKEAIQFTLRFLAKRGFAEKRGTDVRRGKRRVLWVLTPAGEHHISRTVTL